MALDAPYATCITTIKRTEHPCTGLIGPEYWRSNSLKEIKLSEDLICKTNKKIEIGREVDPVHHVRDILAVLSNDEAHRYSRQVRLVVYRLRELIISVNEEIKFMNRVRENLEKEHEHIQKDLVVNLESQKRRQLRPNREKCKDGADDLLDAERIHLLNLKKLLEAQLRIILEQLQRLNQARKRLTCVLRERARVLELVCQAVPNTGGQSAYVKKYNLRPKSGLSVVSSALDDGNGCSSDPLFLVDNLGPYTPEVHAAIQEGQTTLMRCAHLRQDSANLITKSQQIQRSAHESVQKGINQKMAETENLKNHLKLASTETQYALNKAQRLYDRTEHAWWHTRGPESTRDLTTRERLTRPTIKVMQRHPGTNMPEAQEIVRSGGELLDSLRATGHNIGQLKLTRDLLDDDIADKRAGYRVDNSVVKLRGSKAQHRWVLESRPDIMKKQI